MVKTVEIKNSETGLEIDGVDPEEALAFLTNLLVELAFYRGMPVNVLLLAIEVKYGLLEKAYQVAGPDDEIH
jgi:hypothetical protein